MARSWPVASKRTVLLAPAFRLMETFIVAQALQAPVGAKVIDWPTPLTTRFPVRDVAAPRAKRMESVTEPPEEPPSMPENWT